MTRMRHSLARRLRLLAPVLMLMLSLLIINSPKAAVPV